MIEEIDNHTEIAIANLRSQYQNKPRLEALISTFSDRIQGYEDALTTLEDSHALEYAEGVVLDVLGRIVGVTRAINEDDDTFRDRIRARAALNISQGEPEAVIAFFQLLVGAEIVIAQDLDGASTILSSDVAFTDQTVINNAYVQVERALLAGVRLDYITSFTSVEESFSFEGQIGGKGFSDDAGSSIGGQLATDYVNTSMQFGFEGNDPAVGGFGTDEDPLVGGTFVA